MTLQEKKEELVYIAKKWYDNDDSEVISDLDFDEKENAIRAEDPEWDYRLHLDIQGTDRKHYIPMDKVAKIQEKEKSMDEVFSEMNDDPDSDNSPKYDGGGICLYYDNGKLYDSLSRSSQKSGKCQISKVLSMVPKKISDKDIVAIECEIICMLDKGHGDLSRQAATGLLNSNSLQERCEDELTIVAFKVRYKDGIDKDWVQGTKDLPTIRVRKNITFMPTPFNEGRYEGNKFYCGEFSALVDGIVEYKGGKSLAHKIYFNEKKIAVIKKIEWNYTASSMKYVPKYTFPTVNVDGTNVSRASAGGTADLFLKKQGVGAEVEIIKAGLTIPQVFRVTSNPVEYKLHTRSMDEFAKVTSVLVEKGILYSEKDNMFTFVSDHYKMLSLFSSVKNLFRAETDVVKERTMKAGHYVLGKIKPAKGQSEIDAHLELYLKFWENALTHQSSLNTSTNYSLPTKCACGQSLDEKNDLNGGLYCSNAKCSVNLDTLNSQLEATGMKLDEFLIAEPIKFIEGFLKCPRFGGWDKLKDKNTVPMEVSLHLISDPDNPLSVIKEYFHLSGLQIKVMEILNPVVSQFMLQHS